MTKPKQEVRQPSELEIAGELMQVIAPLSREAKRDLLAMAMTLGYVENRSRTAATSAAGTK